jgi:hypothetical protein
MPRPTKRSPAARGRPAPLRWARKFLADYFSDAPCLFHVELMRTLANPQQRLVARVAPRGHAKSTCAALAFPLWCICTRQARNIVIITQESSLARQFVRDIRTELECNERILAEYGDLCGEAPERRNHEATKGRTSKRKWGAGMFTTATGITVQAKGTGTGLRGLRSGPHRPDLIICDDLEKDEHVQSSAQRKKLEDWLRRVVLPALAPDGRVLVLGSIIHFDSLLANLRDAQRWPRWDYAVYRAIEAERGADGEFHRVALWPARWPLDKLDLERERIGSVAFAHEYQANPIDDTLRVFRPEWLRRYEPSELIAERLVNLMAVDPATGCEGGDYFALWVGSLDTATGVIYTRQLRLERIGAVDQVKRVVAAFEQWRPVKVGIETVGYQAALLQMVEEESRVRGLYMPLVAMPTTTAKQARIESSSLTYEKGLFRLPAVLDPEIEEQFLHFPKSRHDDAPDVCAMGIDLARALRSVRVEAATAGRSPLAGHGGW